MTQSVLWLGCGLAELGLNPRLRQEIFAFTTTWRTGVRPTQPPAQWASGFLPRAEADHLPPYVSHVINAWIYTSTHPSVLMACYWIELRDNCQYIWMCLHVERSIKKRYAVLEVSLNKLRNLNVEFWNSVRWWLLGDYTYLFRLILVKRWKVKLSPWLTN
jgi:hypothetical protein